MRKVMHFLLWGSFIVYGFILVFILFLSSRGFWSDLSFLEYIKRFSNFIPFRTIGGYIRAVKESAMNLDIPIKNIVGNLLLLFPMGIYLPCLFKRFRTIGKFIVSILIMLLVIETLQILLRRGSFDIDDIIMNVTGAIIGFAIWKLTIIQKLLNKLYLIR